MRHHQELHSLSLVEVLCLVFTSQRKPWRWHQLQWVQWRPAAPSAGCHHVLASCGELPITADITTLSPDHTTLDNITSRNHPVTRLRHSAPVTSHNVTVPSWRASPMFFVTPGPLCSLSHLTLTQIICTSVV